jgi:hypothetical protein
MAVKPDKAKREELAAEFFNNHRKFPNCVGIFERPVWVMYDSDEVIEWDMRPNANGNQSDMNNYRSIKRPQ